MALGDLTIFQNGTTQGARVYNVARGATVINAGEPVATTAGNTGVTAMATNKPVVGTDYIVGVAATTSTQTAANTGTVSVFPLAANVVYLIKPNVAATWDTQAEYDALVGKRVLIDLTAGSYTILASDSNANGCVIMPLDINLYPGQVAFTFKTALSNTTG